MVSRRLPYRHQGKGGGKRKKGAIYFNYSKGKRTSWERGREILSTQCMYTHIS